jgi:hypothetical protein
LRFSWKEARDAVDRRLDDVAGSDGSWTEVR